MGLLLLAAAMIWALPWTLFGCLIGVLGLATGGGIRVRGRILEFWGGVLPWLARRAPLAGGIRAITFGHTVLGTDPATLDDVRSHEMVHVRQYERWGPFFIPAYLACSMFLRLRKRHPYLDNPFEREAFDLE
jgi:hypothetical protein